VGITVQVRASERGKAILERPVDLRGLSEQRIKRREGSKGEDEEMHFNGGRGELVRISTHQRNNENKGRIRAPKKKRRDRRVTGEARTAMARQVRIHLLKKPPL